MSRVVNPTGSPYIGVGGKRRGIFFDPAVEKNRVPGNNPSFERRSAVVPVPRPGTLAEIQQVINKTPALADSETNSEFQSNFRIMQAVRDTGSKVSDRSWLPGHFAWVQSKIYAGAGQSTVSPFEDPSREEGIDMANPFSFVLEGESEDNYGAVRVMINAYLNLLLSGERRRPAGERYPSFHEIMDTLGITVGGIVNNQTGFVGPGYDDTNLPSRDLVNFCVSGDVEMIPQFLTNPQNCGSVKGLKVYAIAKRMDSNEMVRHGLPTRYVTDNGNQVSYALKTGDEFAKKRFQVYMVTGMHAPPMSELEYTDDNGYLDRAAVFCLGVLNYYPVYPACDPRAVANDVSIQRHAGICTILYDLKEIEFCG